MQTQTTQTPARPSLNCIGCTDCKGLCRDLVELALLPEMVLHRSTASP